MGDALVDQNQLEQIGTYVKNNMAQWLQEQKIYPSGQTDRSLDKDLFERMVTIEQQLKFQNEKLELMIKQSDDRFEQLQLNMDKRFDAVDNRFEQMQSYMDKRFDAVDKRFEQMQHNMDTRFEQTQIYMDTRFEQTQIYMDTRFDAVDKRFEQMQHNMDTRFDAVDKRFNRLYTFLTGIFLTMITGFITLIIKLY